MQSKKNLIQSLVDEGYLKTPEIISAFEQIDRADFVLDKHKENAYENHPLPIGHRQTISQPLTVAFMLELLCGGSPDAQGGRGPDSCVGKKILDVGSGSGWTTALLAHIVSNAERQATRDKGQGKVYGIERMPEICKFGQKNLAKYFDDSRAKIICGDGTLGLPEEAPFDKILAGATASKEIPEAWRKQLKVGGKIVAPARESIWLFTKKSETQWEEKEFPGFMFVPLISGKEQITDDRKQEISNKGIKKINKKWIIVLLAACLLSLAAIVNEAYFARASFSGTKTVTIPQGYGSRKIGELLKHEGIIRSKWIFVSYVSIRGKASSLKPGTYTFFSSPLPEIAADLIAGEAREVTLTFPEGWTAKDIAENLEEKHVMPAPEFLQAIRPENKKSYQEKFAFLKDGPSRQGLEGYLFPDTYRIYKDASAEDVVLRLLENFDKKLNTELREEIAKQKKTIFEIVTMASLIEREVRSDEDRAIVSGILWKRLNLGIALQVDATIVYLTGKRSTKVTREDLQIKSPYNTYLNRGLPIGPISSPGLSAIKAAIYPKKSPYLYYLSAPDGRTIFSRTLEEHNEAKTKYLR